MSASNTPIRRRPLACLRCRRRKVRCDGGVPACSNCAKAHVECFEGLAQAEVSRSRLSYLENRVRELEALNGEHARSSVSARGSPADNNRGLSLGERDYLLQERRDHDFTQVNPALSQLPLQPQSQSQGPPNSDTPAAGVSPAVSGSSRITRDQPLAHEVGLLSLANAADPKYLGPSSGVSFARLIYESAPQSQGLPASYLREQGLDFGHATDRLTQDALASDLQPIGLPSLADCNQYMEAYFAATSLLPFISQDGFSGLLNHVHRFSETAPWDHPLPVKLAFAQVFLVLSLGARFLETKLGADFCSRGLFASGMNYASQIKLHDNIEGVQILLLLVLHSFFNPEGLNAWYLLHTIIASCLDLGLQRRDTNVRPSEPLEHRAMRHLRSALFWSAYSMDRTLTTILGRPLTLRDEAIDRDFPGMENQEEIGVTATHWNAAHHDQNHHFTLLDAEMSHYLPCIYSLRFDRIIAEIKLMIYRVSRAPQRFPWPNDLESWQMETEKSCVALFQEIQDRQRGRAISSSGHLSGVVVQKLELKYHQSIMLLYRPSPQIPKPTPKAAQACFTSAMEIIRVQAELHRFANMECSWLSAHSIFVATITILYCLWTFPAVRQENSLGSCLKRAELSVQLLDSLRKTWLVAHEACQKLRRLIALTAEVYNPKQPEHTTGQQLGGLNEHAYNLGYGSQTNDGEAPYFGQPRAAMNPEPQDRTNVLIDELGILRDLFDLGWLNDVDFAAQSEI
ncbi:Zn(II)2Cys6 transcription factor [Aspergillus melleus]|uniref:Zn(II)2Cys6 transcription factor n=1 Tax=Aspergillus melleus TaxID=138277 RepID=UPI001E8E3E91|nr:uncharacterized protein LDX57_011473 [Aspergillus melleus]KAH8433837.1 hypothetical protein LDX57_011473 [Aspergillus melleus]